MPPVLMASPRILTTGPIFKAKSLSAAIHKMKCTQIVYQFVVQLKPYILTDQINQYDVGDIEK